MDRDLRTLWCGNLSNRITEDILYELFLQAGPLEEVKIPKDRDSRPRAYGFVTYKHDDSVDYALELFKGTMLYNRELCIDRKVRLQQEQPVINQQDMLNSIINANNERLRINIHNPYTPNTFLNPYGSHTLLGYQGPTNMYPSKDRRNQTSRTHPYYRN